MVIGRTLVFTARNETAYIAPQQRLESGRREPVDPESTSAPRLIEQRRLEIIDQR